MSHPIRYQHAGPVRFYRMGTTLIADKGDKTFVIQKYSCGGGVEASMRARGGLKMPIQGDVFSTMRAAAEYLLPLYLKVPDDAVYKLSFAERSLISMRNHAA